MQLSEKTEMLERFFTNGVKMLKLSQRAEIPCDKARHELLQALRNMELIEAEIYAFDKIYYGNRQKKRRDLTTAEYAEILNSIDLPEQSPDHEN